MKRGSSISIGKEEATLANARHNDRTRIPTYLIVYDQNVNWVSCSWKDVRKEVSRLKREIDTKRKTERKKKVSTQAHIMKEFVVNLDYFHTQKTLYAISEYLYKYYHINILQMSIHADEGVFIEKIGYLENEWNIKDYHYNSNLKKWLNTDGKVTTQIIVYRPNQNIFWNINDNHWYCDRQFKKLFDMKKVKQRINYHGHILFFNLDIDGNTIARTLRPRLSKMQDRISDITGLTRGKNTNRKGQDHHDFKNDARRSEIVNELNRKNILISNFNVKLIEQFARLKKEVHSHTSRKKIIQVIKKSVSNALGWKKFAIDQYLLSGFQYVEGDQLDTADALKKLQTKWQRHVAFENEVYRIFQLDSKMETNEAISFIEKKILKNKQQVLGSLMDQDEYSTFKNIPKR